MAIGSKVIIFVILFFLSSLSASAHPHVFIEANLEVFRDDTGRAVELRNVWRFDEVFSASIVVDFDTNGDNALNVKELESIASTIKTNLKEYDYFTSVRVNGEIVDFEIPKIFLADYDEGKLILIVAMDLKSPQTMVGKSFSVSVSDPTYYVAVELMDEESVVVSGGGGACKNEIVKPDFDALYSQSPQVFDKDFEGSDNPEIFNSDDYLTWVNFDCAKTS